MEINIEKFCYYSTPRTALRILAEYLLLFKNAKEITWEKTADFLQTDRKTLWKIRKLDTSIRTETFNDMLNRLLDSGCPGPKELALLKDSDFPVDCHKLHPDCPFIVIYHELMTLRKKLHNGDDKKNDNK